MRVSTAPAIAGQGPLVAPRGLRLARRAGAAVDARCLDRLIRGRVWIALVGAMLIGLVFLQLSLLSLNAGIGTSLEQAQGLEAQNAALSTQLSRMDGDRRVQDAAVREGLIMPSAGARRYLEVGAVPASVAARGITAPKAPAASVGTAPAPASTPTAAPTAAPTATPAPTAAPTAAPASTPAASTGLGG